VAPKTGRRTNPRLVEATLGPEIKPRNKPVIFTNVALHIDGRVWWEELSDEVPIDSAELEQYRRWVKGETDEAPKSLEGWLDWTGEPIAKRQKDRRKDPWAHPNARFTVNRVNLPSGSPNWHIGGRIDAILFGGRNPDGQPPLVQLATLERAILDGLFMAPQETAAVEGAKIGRRRSDPFALRPFYATTEQQHLETWLYVMNQAQRKGRLPAFFHFDQFRKGWPGFRQDVRLIWLALAMAGKFEGVQVEAVDTPLGRIPTPESVRPFLEGLGIPPETIIDMFSYHSDYGAEEASRWAAFLEELGKGGFQLPPELQTTYEELIRVSKEITDAAEQLAGRAKGGLSNYPLTLKAEAPELWDKVVKHKIIIRSPVDGAIYVWNSDQLIAVMRDFYAQGHFDEAMDSIITIDENGPVGVLGFIEKALRFIFGFNFRSDRQRQWIQAVLDRLFNKFNNSDVFGMSLITMARHLELIKEGEFILPDIVIKNGLVEWLGRQDINVGWGFSREKNQFISTFRGGEKPFDNEDISYGNISMPRVVTTARMKTTEGEKQVNVYNQVRNKDYWRYPGLSMRWV
ncbi:MAG: phosphoenolpyruvate carboxykinase (GTP), partial [Candidatus Omnitrophica bacterium]|nr:phosphoenolpyruvate carboxykinase (GTP) [Candidatus Omnitrophota bacterium]